LRQTIVSEQTHRGAIVDKLLDGHDDLLDSSEGRVFHAFHQQLGHSIELDNVKQRLRTILRHPATQRLRLSARTLEIRPQGLDWHVSPLYITTTLYNETVMQSSERLDLTFAALADPTRRAILARLATGEATVTELAEPFEMSQPAISKHLKVLERAGLISMDVDAQRRPRKLEPKRLEEAVDWIERYREIFEQNYQRLDALLEALQREPSKRKRTNK
jgi:DNA-binding transcriptional ArsR family regulator